MNISKKFKNIFYILSKDHESINILIDKLQELYDSKIINTEILLNVIKGLIYLVSIDDNKIYTYIKIFDYFIELDNKNILNDFSIIDFSKQFKVNENKINKIILNTDYILNYSRNTEYKYIINFIYNVTKKIIKVNTSVSNKIMIYNIYMDDVINNLNIKNLNYHNMKFNELINNITKFLK
tara:strand:- start:5617 stop:6159 length:543 start_codon:yes stop_codon:yes gene_type:complete